MSSARLAIDLGGTLTDVVRLAGAGELIFRKVPTTPTRPPEGVIAAFGRAEIALSAVTVFTHGTTLGLKALVTRAGARAAVVATKDIRDLYLLGRTRERNLNNIKYGKPRGSPSPMWRIVPND